MWISLPASIYRDSARRETAGGGHTFDARRQPEPRGGAVGHTYSPRLDGRGGTLTERTNALPTWPPGPEDDTQWAAVIASGRLDLLPASAQPAVRRVGNGASDRVDRLRLLGNGVVPDVAALAWRTLMADIEGCGVDE